MPHAESTAATFGTMTRRISSRRATSVTCRPAAPPKATSVKPRGSTPRRTDTSWMPSAMFVLTTRAMPSAACSSCRARAPALRPRARRLHVEPDAAAEEVGRVEEAEHEVGVGDGGRRAALAVAGGAGSAPALSGPTRRMPPASTRAMEPPPAPSVWMSSVGSATWRCPTSSRRSSFGSPSCSSAMSVLVPPMSNVIRSGARAGAHVTAAATPPAGPESTAPAASRADSPIGATPPCDCMIRSVAA